MRSGRDLPPLSYIFTRSEKSSVAAFPLLPTWTQRWMCDSFCRRFYEYTAFCNGPDEVKSPSDCHAAELTLLSVVSAEAATRCY